MPHSYYPAAVCTTPACRLRPCSQPFPRILCGLLGIRCPVMLFSQRLLVIAVAQLAPHPIPQTSKAVVDILALIATPYSTSAHPNPPHTTPRPTLPNPCRPARLWWTSPRPTWPHPTRGSSGTPPCQPSYAPPRAWSRWDACGGTVLYARTCPRTPPPTSISTASLAKVRRTMQPGGQVGNNHAAGA